MSNIRVLLVDNNDSFTYNIVDYLKRIKGVKLDIILSSKLEINIVNDYDKIICLSVFLPKPIPSIRNSSYH